MPAAIGIFDDEIVSATSLNRHPGQVLDCALRKPVTIMRNEQAFALLRRDQASQLVDSANHAATMTGLLSTLCDLVLNNTISPSDPFEWLSMFSTAELGEMLREVQVSFRRAFSGEMNWDEFDAIIHEWEESAWANRNPALIAAMEAEAEEVPLTPAESDSEELECPNESSP